MIYLILLLALGLRLVIINQSLWLDEAINVLAAKNLGFWHFVWGYPIGDFHPPGYFALLWVWSHIFGFSELSVRLPSVFFGVATVWLTYLIGKELFSKKTGLLAALLLALGPLHVYYSQEARMYSLAAFAGTLSFYFLMGLLKGKKNAGWFYSLSIFMVLYSDYLVYLIIPTQIIFILWTDRKNLFKHLKFLSVGSLTILPWLTVFPTQLANGRMTAENVPGWEKVVGASSVKSLLLVIVKSIIGRIKLSDNFTIYTILMSVIVGFYGVLFYFGVKKITKEVKLLLCWLFIPVILAFTVSLFIPVLSYFRMIFILPALYLLIANGLTSLSKRFFLPAFSLVVLISAACLLIYYLTPAFQRENWKGLVSFLQKNSTSDSLVLFEDSNLPAPFAYYNSGSFSSQAALAKFPADSISDVAMINDRKYKKIFLVDYFVEISDPGRVVDKKLIELGYQVTKLDNIPSIGYIYEYSR